MKKILLLSFIGVLTACGGTGGPTQEEPSLSENGSDMPSEGQTAGRLLLQNNTLYAIETAYLNEVDPDAPLIIRSQIAPGERQDVGQALLPGGWAFELDLVMVVPAEVGFRVRRKALININGGQLVQVRLEDSEDPFSIQVDL
jgi:hypothetical protein